MGSTSTQSLTIPHTESLQLWGKPTHKSLEVPGRGSVPPACTSYWVKLDRTPCCTRKQPDCSSGDCLSLDTELHCQEQSKYCKRHPWPSQQNSMHSMLPSVRREFLITFNKYFSCPSSYSFPQRHHTSLKYFNFFKAHNSLKHTVRYCCTLQTTCPRALPSGYLQ